ncbi:MAG: LysE family translocator [Acidobacteria bacterium]|jgi:threonine/homoserine/homoserine lactone efflux protein|nr:LysE family translocator [Acidobacteriota bacterium]
MMFDSRYLAFASISALLVLSPGATLAVVTETAIAEGRVAALLTVLGVGIGNSTLALGSALGMSLVLHQWPWALDAVKVGGAVYLSFLGLRGLWFGVKGRAPHHGAAGERHVTPPAPGRSHVGRGITTNLLNPPVVLFYMTLLPQFIDASDPFFARFLLLATTHVSMSLAWQSSCAIAVSFVADRFARPATRRVLEAATGAVLVFLGVRLLLR